MNCKHNWIPDLTKEHTSNTYWYVCTRCNQNSSAELKSKE